MDEYPKYITLPDGGPSLIVQSAQEEAAVMEGRASFREVKTAEGSTYEVVKIFNRPTKGKKG
jgi:hypothetical protein